MGTIRNFVDEYNLPYDPIVEKYANFYLDTGDMIEKEGEKSIVASFISFYDRVMKNIDEHAYKEVEVIIA